MAKAETLELIGERDRAHDLLRESMTLRDDSEGQERHIQRPFRIGTFFLSETCRRTLICQQIPVQLIRNRAGILKADSAKPVVNIDLWSAPLALCDSYEVEFKGGEVKSTDENLSRLPIDTTPNYERTLIVSSLVSHRRPRYFPHSQVDRGCHGLAETNRRKTDHN